MDPELARQWGVNKDAIAKHFNHGTDVHEKNYRRGLRNEVNELQAWLLGW